MIKFSNLLKAAVLWFSAVWIVYGNKDAQVVRLSPEVEAHFAELDARQERSYVKELSFDELIAAHRKKYPSVKLKKKSDPIDLTKGPSRTKTLSNPLDLQN